MLRTPSRFHALRHPVFWTALGLLLLNDHVLKGSGLLPGSVTGKLSDFAGLIVAPVLVAAIAGARRPRGRAAAFAVATLPFVAINLSPAAASAFEALGASLGYRAWSDPTDLIALAVLPIAWRICAPQPRPAATRRAVELSGLWIGAFACMATSVPPDTWFTNAYVVNRGSEDATVRIAWLDAPIDCDLVRLDPQRALSAEAFTESVAVVLRPHETMPLDRGAASEAVPEVEPGRFSQGCEAALLRGDGIEPRVLFWDRHDTPSVPVRLDLDDDPPGQVAIEITPDGDVRIATDELVTEAPLLDRVAPACGAESTASRAALPLEWALPFGPEAFRHGAAVEILEHRVHPDGCTGLRVVDASGYEGRATFCLPEWSFPWREGDVIQVTAADGADLVVRGEQRRGDYRRLVARRSQGPTFLVGERTASIDALDCGGDRDACGRYSVPAVLTLEGWAEPLSSGDTIELEEGTLHVRSVERVGVDPEGCTNAEPMAGPQATWLYLAGSRIPPTVIDGGEL